MTRQIGEYITTPASRGQRVQAHAVLLGMSVGFGLYYYFAVAKEALDADGVLAAAQENTSGAQTIAGLISLGLLVLHIVMAVKFSTHVGGKLSKVQYVDERTGEAARGKVFWKLLVGGVFTALTLGLGLISYYVTFRDGQTWLDRAFKVVGVSTSQPPQQGSFAPPVDQQAQPQGPLIAPVYLPEMAPQGTTNDVAPLAPSPLPPSPTLAAPQEAPPAAPAAQPGALSSLVESEQRPTPAHNPWALNPASTLSAHTPVAKPSPVPVSPPVTSPASPALAAPEGLLADETVIDPEALTETPTLAVLVDGERHILVGPVVLGRNPLPPKEYASAKVVKLVDESMRMSKTHVVLVPESGSVKVLDVGATNGVLVEIGGETTRIKPHVAHPVPAGAIIHIGGRTVEVCT